MVDIHAMTMTCLPRFEMYEEGAQLRRAIKSAKSNIVEGYGRRRYLKDFIRHLTYAHASCDEANDHLENLHITGSFTDDDLYADLHRRVEELSKALSGFIGAIERRRTRAHDRASENDLENTLDT